MTGEDVSDKRCYLPSTCMSLRKTSEEDYREKQSSTSSKSDIHTKQLNSYLRKQPISMKSDSLMWQQENQTNYHYLAEVT
jgi:hypothetical protein